MISRFCTVLCLVAVVALIPAAASAQWFEDFDSYAVGSGLHGQGGWRGWDADPAFDAFVTDLYSRSAPNSAEVAGASDIVHTFNNYTSGVWEFIAWQYIPSDFTGESYFIMLNTYEISGTNNWSVQVHFTGGQVIGDSGGAPLPMIMDEWVELRLIIDLDLDTQVFMYGGDILYEASWTEGVSGGGALNIDAVDLFANGASPIYYDDMSLSQGGVATEATSWGAVKSLFR